MIVYGSPFYNTDLYNEFSAMSCFMEFHPKLKLHEHMYNQEAAFI